MVLVAAMLRRVTNLQILVRRSRIFSPRRREEREEKRFQKLRVLRVFAVDFLGCGYAALCSSVVPFCAASFALFVSSR